MAGAQRALRVACFCIFFGHGFYALTGRSDWLLFFEPFGIGPETALPIMRGVGGFDIFLAVLVLIRPIPIFLAWMAFWGMWTAILRPLSGLPIWELLERGGNWGAPLALLLIGPKRHGLSDWLKPMQFDKTEQRSPQ